jgi:ATP-dependent DNA helicase RecG
VAADLLSRLARLGIRREQDLLLHLPLRYEDETRLAPIASLLPGQSAQVEGVVVRSEVAGRGRRSLQVELRDDSGTIGLRFLNFYGSQVAQLARGRRVRASGEVRGGLLGLEMVHPRYRLVEEGAPLPTRLTPVYPSAAGIGQGALRNAVRKALRTHDWAETVPDACLHGLGLPAPMEALRFLHEPPVDADLGELEDRSAPAWRRIVFDELLAQQLSLRRARAARADRRAEPLRDAGMVERLRAALPFRLTAAQDRAWREVAVDLSGVQPMNRLVQGDVGSGKTVIAALAAAQAIGSGCQAALMAPTEILAEQHFRKLGPWMEKIGARIAWLSGSLKESRKREVRERVAAGEVDLLVGTHALIEDSVVFPRLGLAIVDEQHRFGVAQRLALRGKGEALPHQLMMSATPIPRTLAMTYYADLDVSVIDELPPGRRPVITRLVSDARRDELIERVRAAAGTGRQVYWVCPLIEEAGGDEAGGKDAAAGASAKGRKAALRQREALELQTAIDTHARLQEALAPIPVGLVHGRLAAAEKQAVMDAFSRGELQVLVATTVIEVGVDVPNASLMVVEHAERFGLAQLHQLRGRVGRGTADSVCVLLYRGPLSPTARARLRTMYETSDGFEIARRDLELRGPGEFLGARQSGVALLRFADLERDAALAEAARDCAARMLEGHPAAVEAHLDRWLGGREEFLKA